jgi:uncharacterized protein YPO0396
MKKPEARDRLGIGNDTLLSTPCRKLEDQLRETQVAKDELERQQRELQTMMERLEASKNLEAEERARLEAEIQNKLMEVRESYVDTVAALKHGQCLFNNCILPIILVDRKKFVSVDGLYQISSS